MGKIVAVGGAGVIVRDLKKAKDFYTKKLGLKVRMYEPQWGYLALGTTKGGSDASINPIHPVPEVWGEEEYQAAMEDIGGVTGIGFRTGSLDRTLAALKKARVKVSEPFEEEGAGLMASFQDQDRNSFFVYEPRRPSVRRGGLQAVDFVTVATRDTDRAHDFFTKALGLRSRKLSDSMREYRLEPKGTALMPFAPKPENYKDAADYQADLAHVGENTGVMFIADDLRALQEKLLLKGVRFKRKAERAEWGGMEAEIHDPDDNSYLIVETHGAPM